MKVQKRPRSSIRARRTACFSVSSSSRYMSLTSCRALSSWGCRSPFPAGVGRRGRAGDASLARCIRGSGPCGGVPGHGAGHCHGGQGTGEGSQDSGTCGGAGPQSRQRGQTNMHTGKTPKLRSHPEPGMGRVLGSPRAALGTAMLRRAQRRPSQQLGPPRPPGQPRCPQDGAFWPPGKQRQCGSRTK